MSGDVVDAKPVGSPPAQMEMTLDEISAISFISGTLGGWYTVLRLDGALGDGGPTLAGAYPTESHGHVSGIPLFVPPASGSFRHLR